MIKTNFYKNAALILSKILLKNSNLCTLQGWNLNGDVRNLVKDPVHNVETFQEVILKLSIHGVAIDHNHFKHRFVYYPYKYTDAQV